MTNAQSVTVKQCRLMQPQCNDLQAEFFEIVDKFQYRLEQTLSEQIKRKDVLLWMRTPLHMAIRVQIPADVIIVDGQKCASKDLRSM